MRAPSGRIAVIQPLPGIGDMVWHLPYLRALARFAASGRIDLIAKPSAHADQILAGEPIVDRILPMLRDRRGDRKTLLLPAALRLVLNLRQGGYDSAVLLHHSRSLAAVIAAAGIRRRYGYGFPAQRLFLNAGPFLTAADLRLHPVAQAAAYFAAAGWPAAADHPLAEVPAASVLVQRRLAGRSTPLVAFGLGSSEPRKNWPLDRFIALGTALAAANAPLIAVIGGENERNDVVQVANALQNALPVVGWNLAEVAALLRRAAFFVGNDTGILNLAAAVGCRAYGIFGATEPLRHTATLVPVVAPSAAPAPHPDMQAIGVEHVLAVIEADQQQRLAAGVALARA